jgi:peptidyl-tRNA hydrolase
MQQAFERAADCVEDWVKNGIDHAMQEYNKTV